jgi:hypothetical protein
VHIVDANMVPHAGNATKFSMQTFISDSDSTDLLLPLLSIDGLIERMDALVHCSNAIHARRYPLFQLVYDNVQENAAVNSTDRDDSI